MAEPGAASIASVARPDDRQGIASWAGEHLEALSAGIYREIPAAADLSGHVVSVWHRRVGRDEASRTIRVVPDGCMDLMWREGDLIVAGPDTTAWVGRLEAGAEIVGLRFRPGVAPSILGVPAVELVGERPDAAAVLGRRAAEISGRLEAAKSPAAVALVLQDAMRRRLSEVEAPDPLVQQVIAAIRTAPGDRPIRIDRLADSFGISERQLHRRCCAALGYGPKTYARIVRFRRFLAAMREPIPRPLAQIAVQTGYVDQPHLSHEVRRLTGLPPAALTEALGADLVY